MEEEYIRIEQYPSRKPRLGIWLAQRVIKRRQDRIASGHPDPYEGDDESSIANNIARKSTMRIVMDAMVLQALLIDKEEGRSTGLTPEQFPPEGEIYIEADEPGLSLYEINQKILAGEDNYPTAGIGLIHPYQLEATQPLINPVTGEEVNQSNRFQAVMISGTGRSRMFLELYSSDSGLAIGGYDIDLVTGVSTSLEGLPIDADNQGCLNILEFLSSEEVRLMPEPLDAQGAGELEKNGIANPWYVVAQN